MLALISPAKTLDYSPIVGEFSKPQLLNNTFTLVENLKQKSVEDIQKLMKLSDKLSVLNYERYQEFSTDFNTHNSKAALFAFKGDVYTGLDADSFTNEDIQFATSCMRMLSGLYGVLRPLDLIQPYRLEMGTKLPVGKSKNLYEFWGNAISENLNSIEQNYIINLASNEYFKAVNKKVLNAQIIDIDFKEYKNNTYKTIGIYAKKARGKMLRFLIQNRITLPQKLQQFNEDNYEFNQELSTEHHWVFTR
jgi:cytoplasmic iron level regulating protein YaaA (DUF328/UPF0246 family)